MVDGFVVLEDGERVARHTGVGPGSSIAVYRRLASPPRTVATFALGDSEVHAEAAAASRLTATP